MAAEKKNAAPTEEEQKQPETTTEGTQAPVEDDGMVEIELYKDNDKYKNDVFVCVNGKSMQIKRGERVRIPKAFAEVLDNAEAQRKFAGRTIDRLSSAKPKDL